MNEQEKSVLIQDYQNKIHQLLELIINTSDEELDYRPQSYFWTIREHTAHVMDCEIFGFARYRKSIAEPNSRVEGFNQDSLQSNPDYSKMDIFKATQIIQILNEITINHLLSIVDKDWNKFYINHPESGFCQGSCRFYFTPQPTIPC